MESKFLHLRFMFKRIFTSFALMCLVTPLSLAGGVSVKNLGHSSLLIKGDGRSILLNPFKAVGCAAGLSESKLKVDIILASSELADEGARTSEGLFFVQPGSYLVDGLRLDGFNVFHDRLEGRRYGLSTVWTWQQGGLKFAHLGGGASPLSVEDKLLMGRPDVLIIAVGGGEKIYNGKEAAAIVKDLNPKIVIPVQYVRGNVPPNCDQKGVQPFLDAINGIKIKKVGRTFHLPSKTSNETVITLMN